MLESARRLQSDLVDLTDRAAVVAAAAWRRRRFEALPGMLAVLMADAAATSLAAVQDMLDEQNLTAPPSATVVPQSFGLSASDGRPLGGLLEQAVSAEALQTMVVTQIADASRAASTTSILARPAVNGYVRNVGPRCCSRCAILAGRFYRWSAGFKRHERCRCENVPTTSGGADEMLDSPDDLFRQGRITDLTRAEAEAVDAGADLSRVINATKRPDKLYTAEGGLRFTTEAATRAQRRLTPESIRRLSSDRDQMVRLLERNGYIT